MKIERLDSPDSRGYCLRSRLLTVWICHWRIWRMKRRALFGWIFKVQLRQGAGYIGGRTAWVGWRARGGNQYFNRKAPVLRVGYTANGNRTPYTFR